MGQNGVFYGGGGRLLSYQVASICFTVSWCAIVTFILLKAIDMTIGIRVAAEDEIAGLDSSLHGESMNGVATDSVSVSGELVKRESKKIDVC